MPMMITLGVLFGNGLGSLVNWMVLTGICIIFPALILVTMPFMPESPVFLLSQKKEMAAKKSLERLRGAKHDIWGEIKRISKSLAEQEAVGSVSVREMLTKRKYLIPTIVSLMLMVIQQLTGCNAIQFYLADIFLKAETGISPELQATLVALTQVTLVQNSVTPVMPYENIFQCVGVLVSISMVDRFGRKGLMFTSTLVSAICVFALGMFFYLDENKCPENHPRLDCDDGFSSELVNSLKWMPVVSRMLSFT